MAEKLLTRAELAKRLDVHAETITKHPARKKKAVTPKRKAAPKKRRKTATKRKTKKKR